MCENRGIYVPQNGSKLHFCVLVLFQSHNPKVCLASGEMQKAVRHIYAQLFSGDV
jgi:predicted ester cyclase